MIDNLNYEVIETPIFYGDLQTEAPKYKGICRNDTNSLLSIMKDSYKPLYISQFKDIANRLQKASGFELEQYNQFDNGRVVLAYLKNNQNLNKVAGFEMKDYMVVGSSYNGKTSTFIGSSSVMIRCMNSFSKIDRTNKFKHTLSQESKIEDFIKSIENYFKMTKEMYNEFNIWNDKSINSDTVKLAIEKMVEWDSVSENSTKKQHKAEALKSCMGTEINDLGESLFGLFSGFTRFSQHHLNDKKSSYGAVIGNNYNFNQKAYNIVKELEHSL